MIDPADVTAILHAAARARTALTYSEVLNALGFAFSRPKMRALCAVLDDVDAGERGAGRVPLACLVVRASDGLPGQGWWLGRRDHDAPFVGPAAAAYLAARQAEAFAHWAPDPDGRRARPCPLEALRRQTARRQTARRPPRRRP